MAGADDGSRDIYEDTTSNKSYYQPKTQSDFYHTKWTDYKKPDWYHPYNGLDARSEFLYLRKNADANPYVDMAYDAADKYRMMLYLGGFLFLNLCEIGKDYLRRRQTDHELQVIQAAERVG